MADYYACTDLEPLFDEIRRYFDEANQQEKTVSLNISNTGKTYPYVLEPNDPARPRDVQEVAGKALDLLRGEMETTARIN